MNVDLPAHVVKLWRVDVGQHLDRLAEYAMCLSDEERKASIRFVHQEDRERYIVSHGILRYLLGAYLDIDPSKVVLSTAEHGKPYVKDSNVHFNMSHSGKVILYAFMLDEPVGVDVEEMSRDIDVVGLAQRFFAPQETEQLMKLDENQRPAAFIRIWVMKEAYVKRGGKGLSHPLADFVVDVERDAQQVDANHQVRIIDVGPGYVAALATSRVVAHQLKAFI